MFVRLDCSPEQIRTLFSEFGEVAKCQRPTNLDKKQYHSFAFVRYVDSNSAVRAVENMNRQWVQGQELFVSLVKQQSYWSQDESTEVVKPDKRV